MNFLPILFSSFLFLMNYSDETKTTNNNQDNTSKASIISVSTSGNENNYTFNVGISSPDKGCEQYTNWWEIISEDGKSLIYRRILGHSHVTEQPFVRSGGKVSINKNQVVIIRAHMNTSGYGTIVFKGSIKNGFLENTISSDFANHLAKQQPLPSNCAF